MILSQAIVLVKSCSARIFPVLRLGSNIRFRARKTKKHGGRGLTTCTSCMYCMTEKVFIECVRFLLSDDLSRWGDADLLFLSLFAFYFSCTRIISTTAPGASPLPPSSCQSLHAIEPRADHRLPSPAFHATSSTSDVENAGGCLASGLPR